jgi:hypothetical protein
MDVRERERRERLFAEALGVVLADVRERTAKQQRETEDRVLAELERAYARRQNEDFLVPALATCGTTRPLPQWLFNALIRPLAARSKTRQEKQSSPHWKRWFLARRWHDDGLTWRQTWDEVSRVLTLAGRPAKPETVKKSYEQWERSLPPDQRRPRTYRRSQ